MLKLTIFGILTGLMISSAGFAEPIAFGMHANKGFEKPKNVFGYFSGGELYTQGNQPWERSICEIWGQTPEGVRVDVKVAAGQGVMIVYDERLTVNNQPTQTFKLLNSDGRQFGELFCSSPDEIKNDPLSLRSFLQSVLGEYADIW
jgi:hypothetical protein